MLVGPPPHRRRRLDPKFAWPETRTVLGTPVKRVDGPDKVTGRARYTFDINRPGMLYARIVRSPHPHARVVAVDLAPALKAPGVRGGLVHRQPGTEAANRVMFQGDEVAAIVADTEEQAIDAARLVKVQYEVLPHVTNVSQALTGSAPPVFTNGNVRQGQTQESGDLAAGFAAAAHTLEQTYETHVITHVCLESHGTVCEWDGDKLSVWISTQGINAARENFATALKLPQANIRVQCQYMGGGFGSKALSVGAEGLICAQLARETGKPVKLMLDLPDAVIHRSKWERRGAGVGVATGDVFWRSSHGNLIILNNIKQR